MVRRTILPILVASILALGATPVAAQEISPLLLSLHDVNDDGYTYVGNPTNFGYVLLTTEGGSNVHKNGHLRITQNGVVLYETKGMASSHDYDALNPVFFSFPREGPYEVYSEVPASAALSLNSTFTGYVHKGENFVKAKVAADELPASVTVNEPNKYVFSLETEAGELLKHTDALFEVRRADDNWLVFRTHTHTHDEPMSVDYAFAEQGDYTIRIVGYQAFPSKTGLSFEPVTYSKDVSARLEPPINAPSAKTPKQEASGPAFESEGEDYVLVLTSDPPASANGAPANVGLFGNVRLNALLYNKASRTLVPHVNFEASLTTATGVERFASTSLHEYDGHFEVIDQEGLPGTYTFEVTAMKGEWKATKSLQFTVTPVFANAPPGAGPTIVTAKGLDGIKAGVPQEIEFMAATAAGTPHGHSEIELQLLKGGVDGVPILINKLHTHGDGLFGATITFPEAGDYTLVIDPETVHADPSPRYYFEEIGNPPIVPLKVAEGVELPNVPFKGVTGEAEPGGAEAESPLPVLIGLVAVGAAVFVRRRQA